MSEFPSLDTDIGSLGLLTRCRRALELLKVQTVRDFLQVDLCRVLSLRNYGARTFARLEETRKALRSRVPNACDDDLAAKAFLQSRVEELALSRRGNRVLRACRAKTVAEFLALDLSKLKGVRTRDPVTWAELVRLQKLGGRAPAALVQPDSAIESPEALTREAATCPVTKGAWMHLPLFSGRHVQGLAATDLHESYRPSMRIQCLGLPKLALRPLADRGITSLGELLLTPGPSLVGRRQLNAPTLATVQSAVDEFFRYLRNGEARPELDLSTAENFLRSLLQLMVQDKRQRQVLLGRMGWRSKPRTLDDVGRQLGLTRERVRQLEKKALLRMRHWRTRESVRPLYDKIHALLKECEPPVALETLAEELQHHFGWSQPLHAKAIIRLLPAFPGLKCIENGYVVCVDLERSG